MMTLVFHKIFDFVQHTRYEFFLICEDVSLWAEVKQTESLSFHI